MAKSDYYKTLGLDRTASADQIKRAYRKLAQKYHPDKNPDDAEAEEKFKECSEAYSVLSDPKKKKEYDQFGHVNPATGRQHAPGGFSGFEDIFGGFGDMFGDFFGGSKSRRQPRPADLHGNLHLTFDEAVFGCTKSVTFSRKGPCDSCCGSGAAPDSTVSVCFTCSGQGTVQHRQGNFVIQTTCQTCAGAGKFINSPCRDCHGAGSSSEERTIDVSIPAGVNPGAKIRIHSEGEAGADGRRGDVYIELDVGSHPTYRRDGPNVYAEVDVKFSDAALGSKISVETLHGSEKIVLTLFTNRT